MNSDTFGSIGGVADLPRLLDETGITPASVKSEDGGALLALAAHCVMVNEGFELAPCQGPPGAAPASAFEPPQGWNCHTRCDPRDPAQQGFVGRWAFQYVFGPATCVDMCCSLHMNGKMYVHAAQVGNPDNIQVFAVSLAHHLDPLALGDSHWDAVILRHELFYDMFMEYICRPLLVLSAMEEDNLLYDLSPRDIYMPESKSKPYRESSRRQMLQSLDDPPASLLSRVMDENMEHLLSSAPPGIMLSVILATAAAATSAVIWAWQR